MKNQHTVQILVMEEPNNLCKSNVTNLKKIIALGRSSARSARADGEGNDVDVGLTVKLQQKLNKTQQSKDKLEKRVEELEATLTKYKTHQVNIADTLKVCFTY